MQSGDNKVHAYSEVSVLGSSDWGDSMDIFVLACLLTVTLAGRVPKLDNLIVGIVAFTAVNWLANKVFPASSKRGVGAFGLSALIAAIGVAAGLV